MTTFIKTRTIMHIKAILNIANIEQESVSDSEQTFDENTNSLKYCDSSLNK